MMVLSQLIVFYSVGSYLAKLKENTMYRFILFDDVDQFVPLNELIE